MHPTEQVPSSLVNTGTLRDQKTVANTFNNFFLTISEKLDIHTLGKGDAISFLKDSFPTKFPNLNVIPITEAEIKSIISSLKPKTSSGYDEITSKIIKSVLQLLAFH